jgi:hypothetical protein
VLGLPPVGAIVYLFLGREKTLRIFRITPLGPPPRRTHHSAYRLADPFRRH